MSTEINITKNLTLTTTGTSGAATLVDSTLNIPQYSGGGGLLGVHAILPLASGNVVAINVTGSGIANGGTISQRLYAIPFIPNQTFTCSNMYINVNTGSSGVFGRILIYSNLNGLPNTKIYESSNLDCATTGLKTAITTQTFNAGEVYWICSQFSAGSIAVSLYPVAGLLPIVSGANTSSCSYYISPAFGSAPTNFGTPLLAGLNLPAVFITVA